MQQAHKNIKWLVLYMESLMVFVLLFLVLHWWASRLIRPMEVYFYYIIATVSLLPALSIVLRSFYEKNKWLMFFLGAICAETIGVLAFLIIPFFLPWLSSERFTALNKLGIGNILEVSAGWTFASGIWVVGGIGFLIVGYRINKM